MARPTAEVHARHVARLFTALRSGSNPRAQSRFEEWRAVFGALYGERFFGPGLERAEALRRLYEVSGEPDFHELLFCVHTYFARLVASAAEVRGVHQVPEDDLFRWCVEQEPPVFQPGSEPGADLFKPLYQALVPREVRHALGEYYTPDWLAELVLAETGYKGDPGVRLLDPSCGTGTFLLLAIRRAKAAGLARGESPRDTARRILSNIQGFEVNPLAALAARVNYLLALGDSAAGIAREEIPILQADSILRPVEMESFDFVVGNPPWVRWDYLSKEYRDATLPLWKKYGLFSLKGFQARLGAGKKDLSMLFTYAVSDRYLKDGGKLGFVITQEVLKSKGAGEGFRRFRLGEDGSLLRVLKAHDLTGLRPFDGAGNKTAVLVLSKGEETVYPVPYTVWRREGARIEKTVLSARPIGSAAGPWQTLPAGSTLSVSPRRASGYRAMLGANANPYGVFWIEIERALSGGLVAVRNLAEMGKLPIGRVSASIESDLVFPALRGRDIRRWRAEPGVWILAVQDPETRCGYPEAVLRERWPRAHAYLTHFRSELLARALYRKYHERSGHPFYSQFNIAAETFLPYKVVWKRMSNDLTAAVIAEVPSPLGSKIVLPLETTAFIGCADRREAHYLCAILNSRPVREFVRSFSSAGRGFGTPSVIRHLGIPPFDGQCPAHGRLAWISEELHARVKNGLREGVEEFEDEADRALPDGML